MAKPVSADAAAFESMFEAHHRRVLAYAARRLPTMVDAEEVAAETFAVAWRRLRDIPAEPLPWLYGVARRVLANHRRGSGRGIRLRDRIGQMLVPRSSSFVAEGGPATEALRTLGPDDQELVRLVAWEDLTHAEIACVLGISSNAVAIRLHRARRRFREALDADAASGAKWIDASQTDGWSGERRPQLPREDQG